MPKSGACLRRYGNLPKPFKFFRDNVFCLMLVLATNTYLNHCNLLLCCVEADSRGYVEVTARVATLPLKYSKVVSLPNKKRQSKRSLWRISSILGTAPKNGECVRWCNHLGIWNSSYAMPFVWCWYAPWILKIVYDCYSWCQVVIPRTMLVNIVKQCVFNSRSLPRRSTKVFMPNRCRD